MNIYSASQDVIVTISGEGFDLETVLGVDVKFKVNAGRSATLEDPAEPPQAETLSYVIEVKSDTAGIYGTAIMEAVTSAIESAQDWLLAQAAETDVSAEDYRAEALREERMLEGI